MQITHVRIHVKPELVDAFREATLANARSSILEPGVARFDVVQNAEDPSHFVLIEVYRTPEAPAEHRATSHYQKWREIAEDMMAEPRSRTQFRNVFPDDEGW